MAHTFTLAMSERNPAIVDVEEEELVIIDSDQEEEILDARRLFAKKRPAYVFDSLYPAWPTWSFFRHYPGPHFVLDQQSCGYGCSSSTHLPLSLNDYTSLTYQSHYYSHSRFMLRYRVLAAVRGLSTGPVLYLHSCFDSFSSSLSFVKSGATRYSTDGDAPDDEPPVRRLRSGAVTHRYVAPKRRSRMRSARVALDRLQDDLLVEIFSHLEQFPDLLRVRQVCRRWAALGCDPRLWRSLSFEGHENVTSCDLEVLFQRNPGLKELRSLSLAKVHGVSEVAVRNIPRTECAATLEHVDLSWCSGASDKSVVEFSRCPGLRELRLSHCRAVTRRSVRILAVRCPRLEVLDLNCIGGIRDTLLEVIGQNCPRLRVLNIANARYVTDDGVAALSRGCPRLEVLDLSWCCKVTDWAISKVAVSMPRLREVGLSETRVTNLGIFELTMNCSRLEALHLARCVRISNPGVEKIILNCGPRITTLNIASCHSVTDNCVERLIQLCPRLNCLDVSKLPCRVISDMLQRVTAVRDIQVYF